MATIKDVAQAAQVSTAAVSRVLNKDDNISHRRCGPESFRRLTSWAMYLLARERRQSIKRTWSLGWRTGGSSAQTGTMYGSRPCPVWYR